MEVTPHESSRQITIFQNENNVNAFYRLVMRKLLHESISSSALNAIVAYAWIRNKITIHPKIISTSSDILALTGKTCLHRVLLETERGFFGSKKSTTLSGGKLDTDMSLSDREKSVLLLDKRTYQSRKNFRTIECWYDAQASWKSFCVDHCFKCEAFDIK